MTTDMDDDSSIPIIDAHHHLWDLDRNYYPLALRSKGQFRFMAIIRSSAAYLPRIIVAMALLNIVKTVHMEAEWNRTDPAGETKWLEAIHAAHGFPNAIVGHAEPHRQDIADIVLAAHAGSSLVRGIRHKPAASPTPALARRGARGSMDDPVWRRGYALLGRSAFPTTFKRPGGISMPRPSSPAISRIQSSSTTQTLRPTAAWRGLAAWRQAMERAAAQDNVALKISGLGRRGLPWTIEVMVRSFAMRSPSSGSTDACLRAIFRFDSLTTRLVHLDIRGLYERCREPVCCGKTEAVS